MRTHIASAYGLILPEIRLTDEPMLPPGTYRLRLQGVERVRDRLFRIPAFLPQGGCYFCERYFGTPSCPVR